MEKIAVGPSAKGLVDINASPTKNLEAIASAKGESDSRFNCCCP